MRRALCAAAVFAALLAPAAVATGAKTPTLKGQLYPVAFKIEMKNQAGKKLTTTRAGTYLIAVDDNSAIHNFRLKGPGVNKATSVARKSKPVWTVKLKKGTYTFVCDPHAESMRGTFKVT